jgi:hypothetical protein
VCDCRGPARAHASLAPIGEMVGAIQISVYHILSTPGIKQRSGLPQGARVRSLARGPVRAYHRGKQKLLGISKRGNSYLRRLFVHGARAVLQQSAKQSSVLSAWLAQLTARTHRNVAAVALANKLARMAWAMKSTGHRCWPLLLQLDWPVDEATSSKSSCQVCWRIMRWHNGRTRRSRNL